MRFLVVTAILPGSEKAAQARGIQKMSERYAAGEKTTSGGQKIVVRPTPARRWLKGQVTIVVEAGQVAITRKKLESAGYRTTVSKWRGRKR